MKILYKYVCKDKDIGYLPENPIYIFFCDVAMRVNSQTISVSAATTLLAFAMIAAPSLAYAANPHFIGTPTIVKNPDASLTATFKAAGLANVKGSTDTSCSNGGGQTVADKTTCPSSPPQTQNTCAATTGNGKCPAGQN